MSVRNNLGFSMVEMLGVIVIISILVVLTMVSLGKIKEAAYLNTARGELYAIATALHMYLNDYQEYPPDAEPGIAPGLEKYLDSGHWPKGPWPGSVYDWDNWLDPVTGEVIYQISIRFCSDSSSDDCRFPRQSWADSFDSYSSVYYCVAGPCRAHINRPTEHPAYCINCPS